MPLLECLERLRGEIWRVRRKQDCTELPRMLAPHGNNWQQQPKMSSKGTIRSPGIDSTASTAQLTESTSGQTWRLPALTGDFADSLLMSGIEKQHRCDDSEGGQGQNAYDGKDADPGAQGAYLARNLTALAFAVVGELAQPAHMLFNALQLELLMLHLFADVPASACDLMHA